jgi:hypothetical protein
MPPALARTRGSAMGAFTRFPAVTMLRSLLRPPSQDPAVAAVGARPRSSAPRWRACGRSAARRAARRGINRRRRPRGRPHGQRHRTGGPRRDPARRRSVPCRTPGDTAFGKQPHSCRKRRDPRPHDRVPVAARTGWKTAGRTARGTAAGLRQPAADSATDIGARRHFCHHPARPGGSSTCPEGRHCRAARHRVGCTYSIPVLDLGILQIPAGTTWCLASIGGTMAFSSFSL